VWCAACLGLFSGALLLFAAESSSRAAEARTGAPFEPDWADVFMLDGRTYQQSMYAPPGATWLEAADLGAAYGTIRFRVAGNASLGYSMQDGDATLLDAGTTIYEVRGYSPTFRLATERDRQLVLFELLMNTGAQQGRDFLDIGGTVQTIVVCRKDEGVVGRVTDPSQVNRLMDMVMQAPVGIKAQTTGNRYYMLYFELGGGTRVSSDYNLGANVLNSRIVLPPDFQTEIEQAMNDYAANKP